MSKIGTPKVPLRPSAQIYFTEVIDDDDLAVLVTRLLRLGNKNYDPSPSPPPSPSHPYFLSRRYEQHFFYYRLQNLECEPFECEHLWKLVMCFHKNLMRLSFGGTVVTSLRKFDKSVFFKA